MDTRTGRAWRNLEDVSRSAQTLYDAEQSWTVLRRGTDFYREGPLLWLQIDSLMREKSKGARSLDSFAASFFGPPDGVVEVKPYSYEDLVAGLNKTVAYDWSSVLRNDVSALRPTPVSPGLEAAGWKVMYNDEPNQAMADAEIISQQSDLSFSIGLIIDPDGSIADIVPDSAAGRAGLAPGSKLMGVNHRVYSVDLLRQAIANAETTQQPIELLTLTNGFYADVSLTYIQGLRYPHLVRATDKPDLLAAILRPRRSAEAK
jgi:predicted metalloprotease with PDZ domain